MRARRGVAGAVAAALALTLAGCTGSVGSDEPTAAEREKWSAQERIAYGAENWPDRDPEQVITTSDGQRRPPASAERGELSPRVGTELPEAGSVTVDVPDPGADPAAGDVNGLGVEVAVPEGVEPPAEEVTVEVLAPQVADAAGVDGVLLSLDAQGDAAGVDAPETEVPDGGDPGADASQTPDVDAPETEEPGADPSKTPDADAPEAEAPDAEAPDAEAPETEDPDAEASPEAPDVDAPDAQTSDASVELSLDYSSFAGRYGGGWAGRLELVALPDCVLTDPENAECRTVTPVESVNDAVSSTLRAQVGPNGLFAVAAAAEGSTGDWSATPLAPSAQWNVSEQTGAFTWSYPLRVPPAPGGLEPDLALNYSAGSLDGRVTSTNNQSSWVGDGWDLWPGYVERSYVPCDEDMAGGNNATRKTGDLCWKTDNATLVLGGSSTELVKDAATGTWRSESDDNSRIERLTGGWNGDNDGEYWKVTTSDGTQYFFGRGKRSASDVSLESAWTVPVFGNHPGEPCYQAAYGSSSCNQGWRWNLEYVVDASGNSLTYTYARETNKYGQNLGASAASYDRGGYLTSVQYGTRAGAESGQAPLRVDFTVAERCLPGATNCAPDRLTKETAEQWPDVPFDLICTGGTCPTQSPTFFTRKRLTTVTTRILSGSSYRSVDSWSLEQSFPDPGDATSRVLWLASVGQTGLAASPQVALPRTTFIGEQMANRVDTLGDVGPAMNRYRVIAINSESGGTTSINYTPKDCRVDSLPASPESNDRRCIPVWWTPRGAKDPILEYFHKYLVDSIVDDGRDHESVPIETHYSYQGAPGWRYDDSPLILEKHRTWSDFRGYASVDVVTGASTTKQLHTRYRFFRGLDGNRAGPAGGARAASVDGITDADHLNGFVREETTFDGAAVVATTLSSPWLSSARATGADGRMARYVNTAVTETHTTAPALPGGKRVTRVSTTFDDATGVPVRVDDTGDVATGTDDQCTRYEYAYNAGKHLQVPTRTQTVAKPCSASSGPGDVIADSRVLYDGGGFGAAPTRGLATETQELKSFNGTTPLYLTTAKTTYDALGRPLAVTDALGRTTTTAYTPATGPVTSVKTTTPDPDGSGPLTAHTATKEFDPARGVPVKETDANGKITTATYDALGRITQVWLPGRAQGVKSPNAKFTYRVQATGPNTVTSERLTASETYLTSVALYDGLLRERQTQSPSMDRATPGRVVTDTIYDSRGLAIVANSPWFTNGNPGGTVVVPATAVPGRTVTEYDGAGRATVSIFQVGEQEAWRTTTTYGGDRQTVTPPKGGVPSTTITDGRGQVIEARQYTSGTATGDYVTTRYAWDPAGRLAGMTDAAGNTWTNTYDLLGRKTSSTDPDRGLVRSTYDDAGQVTTTTDARGTTLAYIYDALGRKTELREGSQSGTLRSRWMYDTLAKGLVSSSTRYTDGNAYEVAVTGYDDAYRPLEQKVTLPAAEGKLAGSYTTKYTYTPDGQVRTYTNSAVGTLKSEQVQISYDTVSKPERLVGGIGWGVYVAGSKYSPYGEPLLIDAGSNQLNMINYSYQHGTRRLDKTWLLREGAPGYDLDLSYSYDQAGNVTSIADKPAGGGAETQCFAYDGLARLAEAWTPTSANCASTRDAQTLGGPAPYWTSYTYDTVGNRTSVTNHATDGNRVATYTYPAAGQPQAHAVSQVSTVVSGGTAGNEAAGTAGAAGAGQPAVRLFEYDEAGNMTVRGGDQIQNLVWDAENRLDTIKVDGEITGEYIYTADGDRLIRREAGTTTAYLPGGQEAQLTGDTLTGQRYYTFNGQTIAMRTGAGSENSHVIVADHHQTGLIQILNKTGQPTRRYQDPFGNQRGTTPETGTEIQPGSDTEASKAGPWAGDHAFLNKPLDNSGLTQIGARYYDSSLGKFISVDPIIDLTDPQQWAPYTYTNNNPTTYADPTGLSRNLRDDGGGTTGKDPLTRATTTQASKNLSTVYQKTGVRMWEKPKPKPSSSKGGGAKSGGSSAKPKGPSGVFGGCIQYCGLQENEEALKGFIDVAGPALWEMSGAADAERCVGEGDKASCMWVGIDVATVGIVGIAAKLIKVTARAANVVADANKVLRTEKAIVDPKKWDYLFGRVSSSSHNAARSEQNLQQLTRIGIHDTDGGRELLRKHFDEVVAQDDNIADMFTNKYGTFQVRESLLAGPGGFLKLETTWKVTPNGLQFSTMIPMGGA